VGLCLSYTIEFAARTAPERFAQMAATLGISQAEGEAGARALAARIRDLSREVGNPTCVSEMGIMRQAYEARLEKLVDDAFNDTQVVAAARMPSFEEMERLFVCAYDGDPADF
jgi:acetaldehyde dehydrogenase/alcohol dehydrogenase